MPTVLIFHNNALCASPFLPPHAQMPFVTGMRLTAGDFAGRSRSPLLWTERGALEALDALYAASDILFSVDYAFRRAEECCHSLDSLHLAGCGFDIGRTLTGAQRRKLAVCALETCGFARTAPAYHSGFSLHLGYGKPRPALEAGACCAAVCVLQDALRIGGFFFGALSGCFDAETQRSVRRMQRAGGFLETGAVRGREWRVVERLLTAGTVDKPITE